MLARAFPFALLLLAACNGSGGGDHGATLRVDVVGSATDEAGAPRRAIVQATQTGLVTSDASGQAVPGIASSWRVAGDGLSVIFRLRPRTWPDGKPVTASDVVAVFRRVVAPASRNPLKPLLAGLENAAEVSSGDKPASALGVGAPVDNVVEVRLAGVDPTLLPLLAQPGLAIVRGGPRPPPLGPFRIADATTLPIELTRNPAAPVAVGVTLSRILVTPVDDPGASIARFARDRTDLVIGDGLAGLSDARLLASSNALRLEPSWGVYGYLANVSHGPLADPQVRRALAMAIDRDDLGSRLFGAALTPVLGLVPPSAGEPVPAQPDWAIDILQARLQKAQLLLAAAGFSATNPLIVTISLPDAREHATVAAEIAADWARIGVRTLVETRTPAEHARAIVQGKYELALVERSSAIDTPLAFLLPFTCRPGSYCNPVADGLIAAARTSKQPGARTAALVQAEAAMVADTPMITLFAPVRWALVARRVTGWSGNSAGQHPLALLGIAHGQEAVSH
ncbi:MAG: ABC transporter substrate-binding protein [Janthinobacterium lividum]